MLKHRPEKKMQAKATKSITQNSKIYKLQNRDFKPKRLPQCDINILYTELKHEIAVAVTPINEQIGISQVHKVQLTDTKLTFTIQSIRTQYNQIKTETNIRAYYNSDTKSKH